MVLSDSVAMWFCPQVERPAPSDLLSANPYHQREGESTYGYVDQQLHADDGALSAIPLDETKLYPGQPVKRGNTGIQNKICYF